jgi:hypothetical protein
MGTGLTIQALAKELELEDTSVEVETMFSANVDELFIDFACHLWISLVGNDRTSGTTPNVIISNCHIAFKLDSVQVLR